MNLNLDFSFINAGLIQAFILKGLLFSLQLTVVAMLGGIALGTILALMRLSGKPWLVIPAAAYVNTLRSIPRDVSSCACIANIVSSATLTANATEVFLMMFIDSLVRGGMMIR